MLRNRQIVSTVVATCLAGVILGCSAASGSGAVPSQPLDFVLLHTNDNWGETEPCGWGVPTGGFRRRATYVSLQRSSAHNFLLLDTGDALVGGGELGEATSGAAIVAGMNLMDYDAMALGPRELGLGREILTERLEGAEFPVLSANAYDLRTGRLVVDPYTLAPLGSTSVGIIGLSRVPTAELADYEVRDPYQALLALVPDVAEKTSFVVLLTNMAHQDALLLADRFAQVDLVVAALPERIYMTPPRTTSTEAMVLSAERPSMRHTGRYVGRLEAELLPDGTVELVGWETQSMSPEYRDQGEMAELLAGYEAEQ